MTGAARLPPFAPGMRIGLLGGSFNPPHEGHALVTRLALTRLRLDRVWWLVTPGNPLKSKAELAALQARVAAARELAAGPRMAVTDMEAQIGARYTYDTLAWLARRAPDVRFVWIMGADNLRQFHLWRHWRAIADLVPIVVVDRPGSTLRAMSSRAAVALAPWRVGEREAARFADLDAAGADLPARSALKSLVHPAARRLADEVRASIRLAGVRLANRRAPRSTTLAPRRCSVQRRRGGPAGRDRLRRSPRAAALHWGRRSDPPTMRARAQRRSRRRSRDGRYRAALPSQARAAGRLEQREPTEGSARGSACRCVAARCWSRRGWRGQDGCGCSEKRPRPAQGRC